jgi:C6 transcription factor Pro1
MWWSNGDTRSSQKETIKEAIKHTKLQEKNIAAQATMAVPSTNTPPSLYHSPTDGICRTRGGSMESNLSGEFDFNSIPSSNIFGVPIVPTMSIPFDPFSSFTPFEVDVKTETQLFIDDVERRRDSTIMTSCFQPGTLSPDQSGTETWVQKDFYERRQDTFVDDLIDTNIFDMSNQMFSPTDMIIEVEEADQYLFSHFCQKILPIIFPVRETNQSIPTNYHLFLTALQTNKAFLHCCLAIAAVQLKSTTTGQNQDLLDADFERHTIITINEMCSRLQEGQNQEQLLEAALAMIYLRNLVGGAKDMHVSELPWMSHFNMATEVINKSSLLSQALQPGQGPTPLNMSIASWIDILGATMQGKTPKFSHLYREKNVRGESLGLSELMGCADKIMFLISEIACLEELKAEGMEDITLCMHIGTLGNHINNTELPLSPGVAEVASCYPPSGAGIDAKQLGHNITAVFRTAARIYLCSLLPDFDAHQANIQSLVASLIEMLEFIPAGEYGFDRALVWPLLIGGAVSLPGSAFRAKLTQRAQMMNGAEQFGSFARMQEILTEVWKCNDEGQARVHWRDVMKQRGWDYLLI